MSADSLEQAGELKFGQVGIANLRIRTFNVDTLIAEMHERVQRAPKLFERAAIVLDFGGLSDCPSAADVRQLLVGLRHAGVLPVALAYGTDAVTALSVELQLPVLAKFRAQYEPALAMAPAAPAATAAMPETQAARTTSAPGLIHKQPVRSGQQVYAQGRDLVLTAAVGAGAEVIADGSIHVYAPLRGRALAGAQGDTSARIFCREFHAELVAIAGNYRVMEEIPRELSGKPVQVWLDDGRIQMAEMA